MRDLFDILTMIAGAVGLACLALLVGVALAPGLFDDHAGLVATIAALGFVGGTLAAFVFAICHMVVAAHGRWRA